MPKRSHKRPRRRTTHGGRRAGAGRKPVLTYLQQINVGAECERLWREAAEKTALAPYEKCADESGIRDEQRRLTDIPIQLRATKQANPPGSVLMTVGEILEEVSQEIDKALPHGRVISIPLRRPKGQRAVVIAHAIDWCRQTYGVNITQRRVDDCWKLYRTWLSRSRENKT
jgi:hypothetical protein